MGSPGFNPSTTQKGGKGSRDGEREVMGCSMGGDRVLVPTQQGGLVTPSSSGSKWAQDKFPQPRHQVLKCAHLKLMLKLTMQHYMCFCCKELILGPHTYRASAVLLSYIPSIKSLL